VPKQAAKVVDQSVLEMALVGYQAERAKIRAAIEAIQAHLGKRGPGRPKGSTRAPKQEAASKAKPKKTLSAAARKRISEAAKKRWAKRKAAGA